MTNRSILMAGVALVLLVGSASAEEAYVPAPLPPEMATETVPSAPMPVPAPLQADARDAVTEPAMAQETVQSEPAPAPLGDASSYTSTPALGTPPSMPTAQPLVHSVAPAAPSVPVAPMRPAATAPMPLPTVVHSGPVPLAVPAEPSKDTVEFTADDYRRKLSGCIRTAASGCQKRELTQLDRDFLRYDRGSKALSRDDLDEVAEARMLQFEGAAKVMVHKPEPSESEKVAERVAEARRQQTAARLQAKRDAVAKAEQAVPAAVAKPSVQASAEIKAPGAH